HGQDLDRYSFSIILYPDVGYCDDAAAWADTSRRAVVAFMWPSAAVFVHELGHMLGLGHANSVDCGVDPADAGAPLYSCPDLSTSDSVEYGDTDSVMGFGGSQGSFTSFHLARLGWLQPLPVVRGRYTLEGLGAPCGTRALTV